MNTSEIIHRIRIGLALVVSFFTGRFMAQTFPQSASEFFVGGFLLGFILTQLLYRAFDFFTTPRNS